MLLEGRSQEVQGARGQGAEEEPGVGVPFDLQTQKGGAAFQEAPDVAGQKAAKLLGAHVLVQARKGGEHVAPRPIDPLLLALQGGHPFPGHGPFHGFPGGVRPGLGEGLLHVLPQGSPFKEPADHVEDLVGGQLLPDALQLVQERLEDLALAGLGGHQVQDQDRVVGLTVPVGPPHPLLEPGRVPGDVVVHRDPAELEVDPLSRGIRGHQEGGAPLRRRSAEALDLGLALPVVHSAVDLGHPAGEAQALQAPDQVA